MSGRDIALTGVPRGGTTLACRLLADCENTVALFEPMDVAALPADHPTAVGMVAAFYRDTRLQLLRDGTAISKHRAGSVPDNPFDHTRGDDGRRSLQVERGAIVLGRPEAPFDLVIKHNAAFCALLPELTARFSTLAIVRNPLAVLASWNTVDLPVADGRIPAGERLDPELAARLAETPERLARQCIVLDWFFDRFRRHLPADAVLRYEDIVASGGRLLRERAGLAGSDRSDLQVRNTSALYAGTPVTELTAALQAAAHRGQAAWTHWYHQDAIAAVAEALATRPQA